MRVNKDAVLARLGLSRCKAHGIFIALLLLQLLVVIFYGLRILDEWGTDFGIYYVGANSTREDYGLYSGFFDLKGPLYYGFIKVLGFLIPYSVEGAVIVLSITALVWLMAVDLAAWLLVRGRLGRVVVGLGGVSALIAQPSNSSIGLFQASLVLISITLLVKYLRGSSNLWLISSVVLALVASLTRIDAIVVFAVIVTMALVFRRTASLRPLLLGVVAGGALTAAIALFLGTFLHFRMQEMWSQAVVFVIAHRWNINGGKFGLFLVFSKSNTFLLLLASGIPFALLVAVFTRERLVRITDPAVVLIFLGGLMFIGLGSDKDYHLFVFYPIALAALAWLLADASAHFTSLKAVIVGLGLSSLLVLGSLAQQVSCLIVGEPCSNRFSDIVAESAGNKSRSNVFFLNQGWPYLLAETKPSVDFNVFWPLAVEIPGVSERVSQQARAALPETIWVDANDLQYALVANPTRLKLFLEGRRLLPVLEGTPWQPLVAIESVNKI